MTKNTVHAHQVLDILDQRDTPIPLDELHRVATKTFGAEAIYTNCHDDAFSLDELLDFMVQRQKIVQKNGTVQLNRANVCRH